MDIPFIIVAVCMLAFAVMMSVIFKEELTFTIPFTVAFMGLAAYFSFILGLGKYVYIVCFILLVIAGAVCNRKRYIKEEYLSSLKSWGIIAYLGYVVVLSIIYRDYPVQWVDELAIWAAQVKHLFYFKTPTCVDYANVTREYIMGKASLEYLFVGAHKTWCDDYLQRANCLWILVLGLPLYSNIKFDKRRTIIRVLFGLILSVALPFLFFNTTYSFNGSDAIIVMYAAIIISGLFLIDRSSAFFGIYLAVMCMSLTSIKYGLLVFVMAFIGMYIFDVWSKNENRRNSFKIGLVAALSSLLVQFSWMIVKKLNNTTGIFTANHPIEHLLNVIGGRASEFEYFVIIKSVRAFFGLENLLYYGKPPIPNIFWVILTLMLMFGMSVFLGKKRTITFAIIYVIGTSVYFAGVVYMYLYMADESIAKGLDSYPRYSAYWIGGMLFGTIYFLVNQDYTEFKGIKLAGMRALALMLSMVILLDNIYVFRKGIRGAGTTYNKPFAQEVRDRYSDLEIYRQMFNESDKIWVICDNGGYPYYYCRYSLIPYGVQEERLDGYDEYRASFRAGATIGNGVWTEDYLSVNEWISQLEGYTYLYVESIPEGFKKLYRGLFDGVVKEKTIYRINYEKGSVVFEQVITN